MKKWLVSTLMMLILLPILSNAGVAFMVDNRMDKDEVHLNGLITPPGEKNWKTLRADNITILVEDTSWKIKHVFYFSYMFAEGKSGSFTVYVDGVAKGTLPITNPQSWLDPNSHFTLALTELNGQCSSRFSEDSAQGSVAFKF